MEATSGNARAEYSVRRPGTGLNGKGAKQSASTRQDRLESDLDSSGSVAAFDRSLTLIVAAHGFAVGAGGRNSTAMAGGAGWSIAVLIP